MTAFSRGISLGLLLALATAGAAAGDDDELERLGFARQRIGLVSGYGWGFGAFGSEGSRDEDARFVPLFASWSIGSDPFLRDSWAEANVELQLEGQILFETHPKSGFGGGAAVAARYDWLAFDPVFPFFEAGVGLIGIDFDLDQPDGFNFIVQAGAGMHWRLTERLALTLQYRFHHISNAGIEEPNEGFNTHMLLVGPTLFLR
jgi:lipid A 3-O-deacylase